MENHNMETMMKGTLLASFNARRSKLAGQLDQAANLAESASLVRSALEELQRAEINKLTVSQARRMAELSAVLRAAVGLLTSANRTQIWHAAPMRSSDPSEPSEPLVGNGRKSRMIRQLTGVTLPVVRADVLKVRVLQGGICAGLLFGLFIRTRETWTAWPAMLLILALVGLELLSFRRFGRGTGHGTASAEAKVEVRADSGLLLDAVAAALDAIDRAIGDVGVPSPDPTDRAPIESVPELLEVIQELLGESMLEDASLTLKRSKELPTVLARFGVQVRSHEAAERESSEDTQSLDLFDWEPSLDPSATEPVTLKPALVRNGKVLLRGRVVTPAGGANT